MQQLRWKIRLRCVVPGQSTESEARHHCGESQLAPGTWTCIGRTPRVVHRHQAQALRGVEDRRGAAKGSIGRRRRELGYKREAMSEEETCALLYTDVVNSTLLNAQWGDEVMARLWVAHDRAARGLMRAFDGREVGRGDGFLVTFPTAGRAVEFALAYHRSLASLQPPLEARVGIHVGPIRWRQNSPVDTEQGATRFDIDGLALSVVARIMSVAQGRQTLLSDSAVRAHGPTPLRSQSHGFWRLKGLPEPVELFEINEVTASFVPP